MVSLYLAFYHWINRNKVVQVRRGLSAKGIRAHLLGLTLGLAFLAIHLIPDVQASTIAMHSTLFIWFLLVTYFRGLFFVGTALALCILWAFPPASTWLALLLTNGQWYTAGYLFGAIFGLLYNDLVSVFINFIEKKHIKISFAYIPDRVINIVKSPIAKEEEGFDRLSERQRERKLYKYKIYKEPECPYTIALVANPYILKRGKSRDDKEGYELDPILQNRDLFLRAVDSALRSFELDEVLGKPQIWSQVRVVAIFDKSLDEESESAPDFGFIQEFQEEIYSSADDPVDNNLLDPMEQMYTNVSRIIDRARQNSDEPDINLEDFDIIMGISASETHDRATAHFTDWIESSEGASETSHVIPGPERDQMIEYDFEADPFKRKMEYDIHDNPVLPPHPNNEIIYPIFPHNPYFNRIHEQWPTWAGRSAINIYGARQKTYIHEFAHTMSNVYHGMIADEYFDYFAVEEPAAGNPDPIFNINRIDRNRRRIQSGDLIPVHKEFAVYEGIVYKSDCAHPSEEEGWSGYFPERMREDLPCTMDRSYGPYRFDELISAFMKDRLIAKLQRTKKPLLTREMNIELHGLWQGEKRTSSKLASVALRLRIPEERDDLAYSEESEQILLESLQHRLRTLTDRRFDHKVEVENLKVRYFGREAIAAKNLGGRPRFSIEFDWVEVAGADLFNRDDYGSIRRQVGLIAGDLHCLARSCQYVAGKQELDTEKAATDAEKDTSETE